MDSIPVGRLHFTAGYWSLQESLVNLPKCSFSQCHIDNNVSGWHFPVIVVYGPRGRVGLHNGGPWSKIHVVEHWIVVGCILQNNSAVIPHTLIDVANHWQKVDFPLSIWFLFAPCLSGLIGFQGLTLGANIHMVLMDSLILASMCMRVCIHITSVLHIATPLSGQNGTKECP